jgi:2-keto-3-deoxy-L-rhamnonate aldolase RhmA
MRENPVKQKLARGGIALGTFVTEFPVASITRVAHHAGAEFVVIDQEHTGISTERVRDVVEGSRSTGIVPLVRVPDARYHLLAQILDVGALGVVVPMVEDVAEARRIVDWVTYPPGGSRGFGLMHRDDHESDGVAATMRKANAEQLIVGQIETRSGLEDVEAIAAVDGLDVLWVGHFDLTASLGIPGEFDHPDYLAALDRILKACKKHKKAAGILVANTQDGELAIKRGFRAIAYSADLWLYQDGLAAGIAALAKASKGRGRRRA